MIRTIVDSKFGGEQMYIILVYDIQIGSDNSGVKNWRNIFKICKRYLHHIQNSVFEGEISKAKLEIMKYELLEYVRKDQDSLIIFSQSSNKWLKKDLLGIVEDKTSNMI